ncbi:Macrolide export ATP-binding/permease protein MacB [Marinomonas gallaica]|uniref:Macrolide export ATP-binding/permease protein MacB n=1 Tax=Marinomonas gallaica TaxID=1806667 RepID=A0A1C3JLA2_9GAMM|nr:MacB family efflux pump subunit [Marinomonas gallaica]SBT16003.1 Macrolide export ATP-binding/permease protein MacB [Marinomonas gallaica]SBT21051.1 Macrolide export ATP-binding/permease protein MacB [Marinomonas gallaica]
MASNHPLLAVEHIHRSYHNGDAQIKALDDVSLTIEEGEFVAIMGQSGSGKSTLMNIIGCLDTASEGRYFINGHDVSQLNVDQLAALRLKTFGFVFQRYQLLPALSAQENVALPALYANTSRSERYQNAIALLQKLGLEGREHHKPTELSGGQQQRVSIARALINGAEVILADEPTGALDSKSSEQVLELLGDLNQQGVTIILITHDAEVAAKAKRQIHIQDGKILSDNGCSREYSTQTNNETLSDLPSIAISEAVSISFRALYANWFRTLLTLLGVVIGVAAVVAMMAIGEGGKQQVIDRIESMGTNLLLLRPGGANMRNSGDIATLTLADVDALALLPELVGIAPEREGRSTIRYLNRDYRSKIMATTPNYLQVRDWEIAQGVMFNEQDNQEKAPVIVIGATIADSLFPNETAIGRYVMMKNSLYQVIGILTEQGASSGGMNNDEVVLIPLQTGLTRVFSGRYLGGLTIKVKSGEDLSAVEESIRQQLIQRHGKEDFGIFNTASLIEAVSETQNTMTMLLGSIAAISLLVGGIGVMNIMLVSVTERRREIGLRLATGAKPKDILRQFNIEALVVCCSGGIIGVLLGIGAALLIARFDIAIALSWQPAALAFASAFLVGLIFGHAPARKASRLNPIDALAEE